MNRFVLGIAPLLLAAGGAARAADAPIWRVSEASGNVVVVESGRSHDAAKGALLSAGAVVIARAGGRAVLVHDRDFVIVSPGARIRIAPPEQARTIYQVIAEFGTSLFRIEHQDRPHFGVRTPYLAAVVKGTVFSVTVGDKGASVQVTQGAVDVATLDGGAHELIRPGMIGSVEGRDRARLNVDGDGHRVIHTSAVAGASAASAAPPAPPADIDEDAPAAAPARVAAPVDEAPVSLADVTDGLVRGSSGAAIAIAAIASKPALARDSHDGNSGAGAATGSGGSANNGNANGNSGSGGSGSTGTGASPSPSPSPSPTPTPTPSPSTGTGTGTGTGNDGNGNGNANGHSGDGNDDSGHGGKDDSGHGKDDSGHGGKGKGGAAPPPVKR